MEKLSVHLSEDQTSFTPRQTVQGTVQWSLPTNPPTGQEIILGSDIWTENRPSGSLLERLLGRRS